MIKRYSRKKKMVNIWSPEEKYKIWFEIEAHAFDAMALIKKIPKKAAENIRKNANFNVSRIEEIEKSHSSRCNCIFNKLIRKYWRRCEVSSSKTMTSSDVLDTTLSIQLKRANEILLSNMAKLLKALKKRMLEHKYTLMIGRSHGIHAEPITFGIKLATFYSEFKRNKKRLELADKEIGICSISGAVGTFANVDPFIEEYIAKKFQLDTEEISTQIIPRDRHAMYFSTLGVIASSIERLSVEIRHLQRTEVREVEEFFHLGQKGSSAMPHKRNPVLSNLTGLARIIRGSVIPALENVSLWHERDISHSSVERMIAPDVTITLDFAFIG